MNIIQSKECPNCGCKNFNKVFNDTKYDNDLYEFSRNNNLKNKYASINFDELSQSAFSICKNCLLVFSTKRRREENMYSMEFFADVQKRWYAQYPVPQKYIDQHKIFSKNFINILTNNNFLLSQKPKVLWLRTECGILTMDLLKNVDKNDIYIMEYFDSNVRFLRDHGFNNVKILPPGDFVNPFGEIKFTEIFLNHQLTHSFDPLKLTKTLLDLLDDDGRIFSYNEINHIEANKIDKHYPRGINNFHNQLLTKNSLSNILKTNNASIKFYESLDSLKNASVHSGMFGVIKKDVHINEKPDYINSEEIYQEELDSFRNWMKGHKKFKRNLRYKNLFIKFVPLPFIKRNLKKILSRLRLYK